MLTEQVRLGREENNKNSEGFRLSFSALYDKYSELASRVKNADLLRELHRTQKGLKDTQSKLDQPKATLTATFWTPNMTLDNLSRETTLSKGLDGSVTINIMVVNTSDVAALHGTYTIRICQSCKFAKEPTGLSHFSGSPDQDRQRQFDQIVSKTGDEMRTLEILPPPSLLPGRFEVDVIYSCVNCVFEKVPMFVTVQ